MNTHTHSHTQYSHVDLNVRRAKYSGFRWQSPGGCCLGLEGVGQATGDSRRGASSGHVGSGNFRTRSKVVNVLSERNKLPATKWRKRVAVVVTVGVAVGVGVGAVAVDVDAAVALADT